VNRFAKQRPQDSPVGEKREHREGKQNQAFCVALEEKCSLALGMATKNKKAMKYERACLCVI